MRRGAGTFQPSRLPACPCRREAPQPSNISTSSSPSMSTQTLAWMSRWPRPHPAMQARTALSARALMGTRYPLGLLRRRRPPGTAHSWHSRLLPRPVGSQWPRAPHLWALQLQPTLALPLDGRPHSRQQPASPAPSSSLPWSPWRPATLEVMQPSGPPLRPGMTAAALLAPQGHPACEFRGASAPALAPGSAAMACASETAATEQPHHRPSD